jgi:hypothetical protein
MKFVIDVVFVDRNGAVLKGVEDLKPWRIAARPGAFAVVELNAGAIRRSELKVGDSAGAARVHAARVSGRSFWNLYGLPLVMVAASIVTIVAVARRPDAGATDFKTFYQSSRQYLAGTDPYVPFDPNRGPNLNPPWVVAVMAQLGRAPLPVAAGVWWAVSFVCLFAAIALIARAVAPGHAVAIASSVLVTQAAYANLRLGQVAWPLMLLLTGAWLADRSRRPVLCGVLVGAAAAWKPFSARVRAVSALAPRMARVRGDDGNDRCDGSRGTARRWRGRL